jgi:hypothetical protein
VPRQPTAQEIADSLGRYGTWLPATPAIAPAGGGAAQAAAAASGAPEASAAEHWVGTPLRVVRGQDRAMVDLRNDLAYDGLLVTDQD